MHVQDPNNYIFIVALLQKVEKVTEVPSTEEIRSTNFVINDKNIQPSCKFILLNKYKIQCSFNTCSNVM